MVKVKVCGITNLADAEKALEYGADALGFNFYSASPRFVTPQKASAIVHALPERKWNVALFVNETQERVREILACGAFRDERRGYDFVQFHGEESGDYCRGWGL